MWRYFLTFVLILIAGSPRSVAQSIKEASTGTCATWGNVYTPGRPLEDATDIELVDEDRKTSEKTHVINGNFDFHTAPQGVYQFRVTDKGGHVLYRMTNPMKIDSDRLLIVVPQVRPPLSATNTVSLGSLRRKINSKAHNEYNAALQPIYDGNMQKAIEHLVKALDLDPELAAARTTLVFVYSKIGRYQDAAEQARRAFELDPELPESAYNYAVLLMSTRDYGACETVIRSVLRNQSYLDAMKAFLAVSLIRQGKNISEALGLIQQSAAEFPLSRLLAAKALTDTRQPVEALNQIRTHLKSSPNECERKELESWMEKLMPEVRLAGESH